MLLMMLKEMFFKNTESICSFVLSFINVTFIKKNMKQESIIKEKNWNKINF